MSRNEKQKDFSLNIGISSILFIFIILCLVSFATLSLASAVSDKKLSDRVLSNSEKYYNACNEAEDMLASFDATLAELYETGISRTGFFETVGKKKAFSVPVTDIQTLMVEIKINYPEGSGEHFYEITSWKLVTTGELEYDDSINVFK